MTQKHWRDLINMSEFNQRVVVDRSRWDRGQGAGKGELLSNGGTRCALGFYLQAIGVADVKIKGKGTVCQVPRLLDEPPSWMTEWSLGSPIKDSEAALDIMMINDSADEFLLESEREEKLVELFLAQGIDLEFIDGVAANQGESR